MQQDYELNMNSLCDRITEFKCQKHAKSYSFVCIEANCRHQQRLMCERCINPRKDVEVINITNTFEFLEDQQTKEMDIIRKCKAELLRQFEEIEASIMKQLKQLKYEMEDQLSQIIGSKTINRVNEQFGLKELTLQDIDSLGQFLATDIGMDDEGVNYIKEGLEVQLPRQSGYIKSTEIIGILENTLATLNQIGTHITNQANLLTQVVEQPIICNYEPKQDVQLKGYCRYICFNHDETQIAAAVLNSIVLLNLDQNGQWIEQKPQLDGHTNRIWQVKYSNTQQLVLLIFLLEQMSIIYQIFFYNLIILINCRFSQTASIDQYLLRLIICTF